MEKRREKTNPPKRVYLYLYTNTARPAVANAVVAGI